ncbi:ent-copalyl diphosphate synthase 1, chloroplastic-like [Canna indica]|uniref:Ent-copalyl diphosphate synthase 1, chloroplastic-like n=1 Tax=Canna indica TaxID=4628 RepID=A0AAQ3QJI8_9LILI|nr:ent-copalyl diphosphate synthase 1, chloroplastic-like [Canna indica]
MISTTMAVASVGMVFRPRAPANAHPGFAVHLSGGACDQGIVTVPVSLKEKGFARLRSHALSKSSSPVNVDLQVENDDCDDLLELDGLRGTRTWQMVDKVKSMLRRMDDGEISISAYDTAWVAMVKHSDGSGGPQFPSSLQWIADNQLPDGSWGDADFFTAHDRMINTLACVVALKSWNLYPDKCDKGLAFISENMWRMGGEEAELMPIGFEIAFPNLIDMAKALELDIPYDDPALQLIYEMRNVKLKRIPKDVMHQVPTTLLHSLEGMADLNWERLLRLQSSDGSFLFSPSSTAYALMQTGDENCHKYLERIVQRFNGGVPNVYPVDLFEHLWVVDRLQRLGISRYFEQEIKDSLDYVYRYWTDEGICWAKNTSVRDVDDTAMGFRLLRLHGYDISPDVFQHFEKDGEFFCFVGQSNQAVTGMYNLNRAAQVAFPGDEILDRAGSFSYNYLRERQSVGQLVDKWIITKDLPGEVEYALDFPWYASLPRVETRMYLDHYGGERDVWIGKTLYKMPLVNNDTYLELAKLDFKQCQTLHRLEWFGLQKWFEEAGLEAHGVKRSTLLKAYFLATACIFEPNRAVERLAWARTVVLAEGISTYFRECSSTDARQTFIMDFLESNNDRGNDMLARKKIGEELPGLLRQLVNQLGYDTQSVYEQQQVCHHLRQTWKEWLLTWKNDIDGYSCEATSLLLVRTIEICARRFDSTGLIVNHPDYSQLAHLLSSLGHHLYPHQMLDFKGTANRDKEKATEAIMQELTQCVLETSENLNHHSKQTFLMVAKSLYYAAYCSSSTLKSHISKVLFNPVD